MFSDMSANGLTHLSCLGKFNLNVLFSDFYFAVSEQVFLCSRFIDNMTEVVWTKKPSSFPA